MESLTNKFVCGGWESFKSKVNLKFKLGNVLVENLKNSVKKCNCQYSLSKLEYYDWYFQLSDK